MIYYKSENDIALLKESGKILVAVLLELKERAKEGIMLKELDEKARELIQKYKATPAFLNYKPFGASKPFPASICTSLNDEIVHGLPNERVLKSGDILKIDLGVVFKGFITDAALTVGIGEIGEKEKFLIETGELALRNAIQAAKSKDARLGDIGWAIQSTVEERGFSVVEELTGHGVGYKLHEDPVVYNYGEKGSGIALKEGLVLAIEPMVSAGSPLIVANEDGSYSTKDGSFAVHFEKTIAITKNGVEILTPF